MMGISNDNFVKSCHSGLSGIGCLYNVLTKKDSGQANSRPDGAAGMTALRSFKTSCEIISNV